MRLLWSSLALATGLWSGTRCPFQIKLLRVVNTVTALAAAETPTNDTSPSATFAHVDNNINFTFTITANRNGDIWFSMAAPATFGWFAVGTGSRMAGSLMFVAYGNGSDTGMHQNYLSSLAILIHLPGVTLSPRLCNGHNEPTFSDAINLSMVSPPSGPANMYQDGMYFVSGACKGCTHLAPNTLDLNSTAQPFIFALGEEGRYPSTPSMDGPLRRHAYYGVFTMDMTKATDNGGDDAISLHSANANAELVGHGVVTDHDVADPGHALIMVLAWLIVFPLGVLSLRVLKNVKLHMMFQTIGLILGILGAFSGFYLTILYNRSKHFDSTHQIIGLLLVIALIGQWVGGFLHHRYYVRNQRPWMNGKPIKVHKLALGPIILAVGLVNAAIGFNFAVAHQWNYIYVPLAIVMIIATTAIILVRDIIARRLAGRKQNLVIGPPQLMPFGSQPPPTGPGNFHGRGPAPPSLAPSTRSDIALDRLPSYDPPNYSAEPVKPRDMI